MRQRIARARFHEYGTSVDDMEGDFPVVVGNRRRRVDLADYAADQVHWREVAPKCDEVTGESAGAGKRMSRRTRERKHTWTFSV